MRNLICVAANHGCYRRDYVFSLPLFVDCFQLLVYSSLQANKDEAENLIAKYKRYVSVQTVGVGAAGIIITSQRSRKMLFNFASHFLYLFLIKLRFPFVPIIFSKLFSYFSLKGRPLYPHIHTFLSVNVFANFFQRDVMSDQED